MGMRVTEVKPTEFSELQDVPIRRKDDPTTAIQIKYVEDLLEAQFSIKPVPLLRRPVANWNRTRQSCNIASGSEGEWPGAIFCLPSAAPGAGQLVMYSFR